MRSSRFIALLVAFPCLLGACASNRCMKPEYARTATVTSEYQLVAFASGTRREERGFGPEQLTLHLYDPFACMPGALRDSKHFYVELGPGCRLMATPVSHHSDTGRYASGKFVQSEARLVEGQACALDLDGGRRIEGKSKSGLMVIRSATVQLDLSLSVAGGTFHLTETGAWI